jgi:hypothetical protein
MIGTFTRVSLVLAAVAGLTGAAAARDGMTTKQSKPIRTLQGFKPSYQPTTNVAGPEQPYTWPVSERYSPVSRPYFGKAY